MLHMPSGRDIWCASVSMDGLPDNIQFCICSLTIVPNWRLLVHRVAVMSSLKCHIVILVLLFVVLLTHIPSRNLFLYDNIYVMAFEAT